VGKPSYSLVYLRERRIQTVHMEETGTEVTLDQGSQSTRPTTQNSYYFNIFIVVAKINYVRTVTSYIFVTTNRQNSISFKLWRFRSL
jgi:hypothetical protein